MRRRSGPKAESYHGHPYGETAPIRVPLSPTLPEFDGLRTMCDSEYDYCAGPLFWMGAVWPHVVYYKEIFKLPSPSRPSPLLLVTMAAFLC
jgi:hypothetical protein